MGLFTKKIRVTFINKKWDIIKDYVKVNAVPRVGELIYLGDGENYYKVTQVIHWPSKNSQIYIVIESLSDIEENIKSKLGK
jgi:hypothetical protein